MEIFDIVDEFGNPTGQTIERKEAHEKGIRHRTAHVWVLRKKEGRQQILLQKRAANKESFPGRYDTSSAGHIQAGDEPLPSAIREFSEELGVLAVPEELSFVGNFYAKYEREFHGKMFRDNEVVFVFLYQKEVDDKELCLQEEVESVEWFDLQETYEACKDHNPKFCVPVKSLQLLIQHLGTGSLEE